MNAVVDSALGIVGINHKISSSDWMRSRLYALSLVDHSSYSNFHATASFRKIDNLGSPWNAYALCIDDALEIGKGWVQAAVKGA